MTKRLIVLLLAMLAASPALIAQNRNWKQTLAANLEAVYPLTEVSRSVFGSGAAVRNTGIVLVVLKPGMLATQSSALTYRVATVRNGQLARTYQQADDGQYLFKVGDRVHVERINVHDDGVSFRVWTVDPVERVVKGTTSSNKYKAEIKFEVNKASLPTMEVSALQEIIGAVLATEAEATAPKTIALGQSIAEVESALGKPTTIIDLGPRKTYVYPNMRVIFTDGKVSDVQ